MVVLAEVLQDLQLNTSLIVVFLLVLDYFDCDLALFLVIDAAEGRAEAALAQELHDLVPVPNVVADDHLVVTLLVVIAVVIDLIVFLFFSAFLLLVRARRRLVLSLLCAWVRRSISTVILVDLLFS